MEIGLVMEQRKTEARIPISLNAVPHPIDCIVYHERPRGDLEPGWYACQLGPAGNGVEGPRRVWRETQVRQDIRPGHVCVIPEPIVLTMPDRLVDREIWAYFIYYPLIRKEMRVTNWKDMPDRIKAIWNFESQLLDGRRARDWMYRITVKVVDVRVERLHDISRGSLIREGATAEYFRDRGRLAGFDARWDREIKHAYWIDNPWCWVVRFFLHKIRHQIKWEDEYGTDERGYRIHVAGEDSDDLSGD